MCVVYVATYAYREPLPEPFNTIGIWLCIILLISLLLYIMYHLLFPIDGGLKQKYQGYLYHGKMLES